MIKGISIHVGSFRRLVIIAALLALGSPAVAQDPTIRAQIQTTGPSAIGSYQVGCDGHRPSGRPVVRCVVRFDDPVQLTEVRVASPGGQAWTTRLNALDARQDDSAFLIAVDRSDTRRQRTIQAIVRDLPGLVDSFGPNHQIALGTFANQLDVTVPFTSDVAQVRQALANVRADGQITELYRVLTEDVPRQFVSAGQKRKVLVLISDGIPEDTAFTIDQAIAALKAANIRVVAIGYSENQASVVRLQTLRRIASETRGYFIQADVNSKALPQGQGYNTILGRIVSSYLIEADAPTQDLPSSIEVVLRNADNQSTTFSATLAENVQAPPPPPDTRTPPPPPLPPPTVGVSQNPFTDLGATAWLIGGGILGFGFLLGSLGLFLARREQARLEAEDAAVRAAQLAQYQEHQHSFEPASEFAGGPPPSGNTGPITPVDTVSPTGPVDPFAPPTSDLPLEPPSQFDAAAVNPGARTVIPEHELSAPPPLAAPAYGGTVLAEPIAYLEFEGELGSVPMRKKVVSIGRNTDNDIVVPYDTVSREHAVIALNQDGQYELTNLRAEAKTPNPILVNGQQRARAPLEDGDAVQLGTGDVRFVFRLAGFHDSGR